MTQLVKLIKEEPVTDTMVVAEGLNRIHKNTISLVRTYKNEFEGLGTLAFETRKTGGRPTLVAVLNEAQVYFLFTLFKNTPEVVGFKHRLVKEFMRMKKALLQLHKEKSTVEWEQARGKGKLVRKDVTDVIQDFVRYATQQGSQNAVRYYSNITKMENKALFILEQKYPNVREMLNHQQLSTLIVADKLVKDSLMEGMEKEMHYKDIYKLAKGKVEALASVIHPTMVISYDEVKVIEG